MDYNNMIYIIPRPPQKMPQWQIILFYFSLALLMAVVIAYFVLNYFHGKSAAALEDLEERILAVGTAEDKKIETEVFASQEKIKDFSELLAAHPRTSQFFEFLEKNTHPKVWFTDLDLSPELPQAKIGGQARNFGTLAQQIYIFREEDLIKGIKLTDISLGEGGEAKFLLNLSLSPEIFSTSTESFSTSTESFSTSTQSQ